MQEPEQLWSWNDHKETQVPEEPKPVQPEPVPVDPRFEFPDIELIAMMNMQPLMPASLGWDQDLPTMVLPMSLTEFMDCFWADDAPFFLPGKMMGQDGYIVNYTDWFDPRLRDTMIFGEDVQSTRLVEKDIVDGVYTDVWSTINTVQHI